MTKLVNRISLEQAEKALSYASHSLYIEGFDVTHEDCDFVRSFLTGEKTEAQFHKAMRNRFDV